MQRSPTLPLSGKAPQPMDLGVLYPRGEETLLSESDRKAHSKAGINGEFGHKSTEHVGQLPAEYQNAQKAYRSLSKNQLHNPAFSSSNLPQTIIVNIINLC